MSVTPSSRRRSSSTWSNQFHTQKAFDGVAKDKPLDINPSERGCDVFIHAGEDLLSPPCFNCKPLHVFLDRAHPGGLTTSISLVRPSSFCLVDDRSSSSVQNEVQPSPSPSPSPKSKLEVPPKAMILDHHPKLSTLIFREILNERELYNRLRTKDSINRRVLYIESLTPLCAIALARTVPQKFALHLKKFLQSYLQGEIYFFANTHNADPTTTDCPQEILQSGLTFSMGFHLSYVTLRKGAPQCDSQGIRQSYSMIKGMGKSTDELYYYDAQISFLITGVDETNWTAYCIADTYLGKGQDTNAYFSRGEDGPSGGARKEHQPCWNPREYFLLVLCQRIKQTAREWENMISILMERLDAYESYYIRTIDKGHLADNADMSQTRSYMKAISILRQLHDTLSTQSDSLQTFLDDHMSFFETKDEELQMIWNGYLDRIESESVNLRRWQRRLMQRMQRFDGMKEGLMSSSALLESRRSTKQGDDIGVLTNMTVAYLPVNLAAAVFSISTNAPHGLVWVYWTVTSVVLGVITFYFAFWGRVKNKLFQGK